MNLAFGDCLYHPFIMMGMVYYWPYHICILYKFKPSFLITATGHWDCNIYPWFFKWYPHGVLATGCFLIHIPIKSRFKKILQSFPQRWVAKFQRCYFETTTESRIPQMFTVFMFWDWLVSWVKSSQNLRNILWKTNIRNPQRQFSPSNRFKGLGIFPRLQSPPPAAETKAWNLRGRSRKRLQIWWLFEGRRARGFWLNLAENEKTEWWIYGKPNNKPSPKRHHFLGGFNHPLKWQVALGCPQ